MRLILLIVFFFSFFNGFSQQNTISHLQYLKDKIRKGTFYDSTAVFENGKNAILIAQSMGKKVDEGYIYQYYGSYYYYSGNEKKSKYYYTKALDIAAQEKDIELELSTYIRLNYLNTSRDRRVIEKEFNRILNLAERYKLYKVTIEAYNALGIINEEKGLKDIAMQFYLKALRIAEKQQMQFEKAYLLNNIGLIKFDLGQINESARDFEKAIRIAQKLDELRLIMNLNNNIGLAYSQLREYEKSIKYYKENLINTKKTGFNQVVAANYINIVTPLIFLKEYKQAMAYVDSAELYTKIKPERNYISKILLLKASIDKGLQNYEKSKISLDTILRLQKKNPNNDVLQEAYLIWSQIEEEQGNYRKALELHKKHISLKDSVSVNANKVKISQLQIAYAQNQLTAELDQEKSKNALLKKESELRDANIRNLLLISFLVFIFGGSFILIRGSVNKRKRQRKLTQKLIKNVDDERSRIAKDLHDDIGQMLSIVKSKIGLFNSGKIENLDGLNEDISLIINQTRKISHELHSSNVEKLGLERSLLSLLERVERNTSLICSLETSENIDDKLGIYEKNQIYRIVQECLNNSIKYSNASAFKVEFFVLNNEISILIQDNGIGLTQQDLRKEGIGLLTIRERAEKIKAKSSLKFSESGFKLVLRMKAEGEQIL